MENYRLQHSRSTWPRRLALATCLAVILPFALSGVAAASTKIIVPDRLKLIAQLSAGEYAALEKRLTKMQDGYETGKAPELVVKVAFDAFANSGREVEAKLTEWLREYPDSYAALVARGVHYQHLGWLSRGDAYAQNTDSEQFRRMTTYFAKAKADLEAAIAIKPRLTVAYGKLLGIAMTVGAGWQRRNELLKLGLAADPTSPVVLSDYIWGLRPEWGGSFAILGEFLKHLDQERVKNPKMPDMAYQAHLALAHQLTLARQYQQAIGVLTKAIEKEGRPTYYSRRGLNYFNLGKYDQAVKDFTQALKLNPQDTEALGYRGWSLYEMRFRDRALADLDQAIRFDPLNPDILWYRATVLRGLKRPHEALRDLKEAMEFGSYNQKIWEMPALIYGKDLKDYSKGLDYLENITRLRPNSMDGWRVYYTTTFSFGRELYGQKQQCKGAKLFMKFLNACIDNRTCKSSSIYNTAAIMLGSAVAETTCPAQTTP